MVVSSSFPADPVDAKEAWHGCPDRPAVFRLVCKAIISHSMNKKDVSWSNTAQPNLCFTRYVLHLILPGMADSSTNSLRCTYHWETV